MRGKLFKFISFCRLSFSHSVIHPCAACYHSCQVHPLTACFACIGNAHPNKILDLARPIHRSATQRTQANALDPVLYVAVLRTTKTNTDKWMRRSLSVYVLHLVSRSRAQLTPVNLKDGAAESRALESEWSRVEDQGSSFRRP